MLPLLGHLNSSDLVFLPGLFFGVGCSVSLFLCLGGRELCVGWGFFDEFNNFLQLNIALCEQNSPI